MIDHVRRSRDGMKIHVVELFDPLGIEYCTFWFHSVVEKARHLFITAVESIFCNSCDLEQEVRVESRSERIEARILNA
jgi:hypothetical protein